MRSITIIALAAILIAVGFASVQNGSAQTPPDKATFGSWRKT